MTETFVGLSAAAATQADVDNAAAIDALSKEVTALTARVTMLEGTPPIPPPLVESGNGATITAPGPKLVVLGVSWELVTSTSSGLQLKRNGTLLTVTNQVITGLRWTDLFYQCNKSNNWYVADAAGVWKQVAGDPRLPPPQPAGVPTPAAAVGYNMRTLGPAVVIGRNWWKNEPNANVTTNPDGSVTLAGPWDYNAQITSGNGHSFGTAFGGGFYAEMDFKWLNPYNGAGAGADRGWPSFWANTAEGRTIGASPNWPNGAEGGGCAVELDIFEFFGDGWGPTVWDWSVNGAVGTKYSPFNGAWNAQGNVKDNNTASFSGVRHKIGGLWVPATDTAKGRLEIYLDGVLRPSMTQTWNRWSSAIKPPLANGATANSIMDFQHMMMLAGSSTINPMIVYGIEIWQRNGSANLVF